MTNGFNLQRILLSLGVIAFVGAAAVGATGAFFNDTETSTGNTFAAGDIDLQIDNTSYAIDFNIPGFIGTPTGALVANPGNSWLMADLVAGTQKFFNFTDVKPGDYGEDTISIHVGSNDAWMCAAARLTDDSDQTCTEPEMGDDPSCTTPGLGQGELDSIINFAFWADDGDNVYEVGENIFLQGPLSALDDAGQIALASPAGGAFGTSPVPGDETVYIGKMWCAGTLTSAALAQDTLTTDGPIAPGRVGTGFTCDGSAINNAAQTDQVQGDMQFYAVQARNNPNFSCTSYVPTWDDEVVVRPLVGAANFVAGSPTCDITANDDGAVSAGFTAGIDAIDDAITAATAGQTICVAPGIYNEFTVNKSLTIRGLSDPEGGTPAVVNPSSASVTDLALITANDVTVTGLKFDGNGTVTAGQATGIRVSPVAASLSGVNLTYNVVTNISAATGFASKGIQWFTDTDSGFSLSNSNFTHNTISNVAAVNKGGYGIQTVGSMSNVAIANNTISNTTGAWGAGVAVDTKNTSLTSVTGSTISKNHIMTGVSGGVSRFSVQVENRVNAAGIAVLQNNIETSLHGGGNAPFGTEGSLNAQTNWWGVAAPVAGVDVFNSGANVTDFTLPEASVFAQN